MSDLPDDFLFDVELRERECFGEHWVGPDERFKRWDSTLIAMYDAEPDGHEVHVYATATPARFYMLHLPTSGLRMRTGTGEEARELVARMAAEFSKGMLIVEVDL